MWGNVEDLKMQCTNEADLLKEELSTQPTSLNKVKLKVLNVLLTQPRIADEMQMWDWKYKIILMKITQIRQSTSLDELNNILLTPIKQKNKIVIPNNNKQWLLEEELLYWMKWSLESPLSTKGGERYMTIFNKVFPKYIITS